MQTNASAHSPGQSAPPRRPRSVVGLVIQALLGFGFAPFLFVFGSWFTYQYVGNYCLLVGAVGCVASVAWGIVALSRASRLSQPRRPAINDITTF